MKYSYLRLLGYGLAGIGLTLALPSFYFWPAGLFALAWLFAAIKAGRPVKAAAWMGAAHYLTSLYWLPQALYIDSGENLWVGVLVGIPALCGVALALTLLLVLVVWLTARLPRWLHGPGFIAGMLALKGLRHLPPIQFPWNPVGLMFAGHDILLQGAALAGIFGLSALALLTAVLLTGCIRQQLLALVLVGGLAVYGALRLDAAPGLEAQATQFSVRLVQGNVSTAHSWTPERRADFLNRYIRLSETDADVDLILWPETAVAYAVARDPALRQRLARLLSPPQKLGLGFLRVQRGQDSERQIFNSFAFLDAEGAFGPVYDKHVLVPFGEALPFPTLTESFLRTLSFNRSAYTPGTQPAHLKLTAEATALPLICYEVAFGFYVQEQQTNQTFLLNVTNDTWFDGTTAPAQHFALARVQAVATGLPLVRVANSGISAVTDGYGRIIARLPVEQAGALNADVPVPVKDMPPALLSLINERL